MKGILAKCCLVLLLTSGVLALSSSAEAYYYSHCRYVKGHWSHHHYVRKHVVCYDRVYYRHHRYESYGYTAGGCCSGWYPSRVVYERSEY